MSTGHKLAFLTHASTDLASIASAVNLLPAGAPTIIGLNLQDIQIAGNLAEEISGRLASAAVIVVRLLGRPDSVTELPSLIATASARGQNLLVLSGTGEPDLELTCLSNVSPDALEKVRQYFACGGLENIHQMLLYLSDHFLLTGFGHNPPAEVPDHGVYHPKLRFGALLSDVLALHDKSLPTVGLTFYRAHWLSRNLAFVDALIASLEEAGLNVIAVFTASLKQSEYTEGAVGAFEFFSHCQIDALVNTTSFAIADMAAQQSGNFDHLSDAVSMLTELNVPIVQAITSQMTELDWLQSARGLNPIDTAMNVVIPEFDGRIVTVPTSFKRHSQVNGVDVIQYEPNQERARRVAAIVKRLVNLRRTPNGQKRIAFILTNSNTKASQIGNAVGLDAPASLVRVLNAMTGQGYRTGDFPQDGNRIIHDLIDRLSYDQLYITEGQCKQAIGRVSSTTYTNWFLELPDSLQSKMTMQWGSPPGDAYVDQGDLIIAGLEYENVLIALQPPRGYGMDPNAIYHMPDLPPTHHYYAMYRWLRDVWSADAIVHFGKHGTLEWLPGKGVGLSAHCYPDALLADLPLIYPFIINDPGEGSQAKRRGHAVIIDHLTPAMTTAQTYGVLAQLVQLVDEYYQMELLDPSKLPLLQQQIWNLVKEARLDSDIELILKHDHDEDDDHHHHDGNDDHHHQHEEDHDGREDHDHHNEDDLHHHDQWNSQLSEHGVPLSLAEMNSFEVSHLIQTIDGYLCELGMAEIRDGLHIFGNAPKNGALIDMLCSLARLQNGEVQGLQAGLASLFGHDVEQLLKEPGKRLDNTVDDRLRALAASSARKIHSHADILEEIEEISATLLRDLQERNFEKQAIASVLEKVLGPSFPADLTALSRTLAFICTNLVPKLAKTDEEIHFLLAALAGDYVPPGPSGAPTRGMAHILPTGRNFYSVDPRSLPSKAAWTVGEQLARQVLSRHLKESGKYPENVSISVWGTSAMRTHGDDVAEILALVGARPIWQPESRRITGVELIPLAELQRPRIDVTVRISGFFRDAFAHLIQLIDRAVQLAIAAPEDEQQNYLRKHYLADIKHAIASQAIDSDESAIMRRASYRIFGAKPGSYGAGILPLINEKNWKDESDFARAYVNWGGYAYTASEFGVDARSDFGNRLASVEVALHNQDNREHDIFDSDDYLQFHGGMIATIKALSGKKPRHYFGDTHNPALAVVRDLKEEVLRVFRSRVVNPKWIESIQRHGYKGGLELTATVDYLFGYDATAGTMEDWMYEQVAQEYALSATMQEFLKENNPWALNSISERLLEASQRKMWRHPDQDTLSKLQELYLSSEAQLEGRSSGSTSNAGVVA